MNVYQHLKKRMLIKCWIPTSSYDYRFVFSTLWNSFWFGNIDKFERTEPSTIMSISLKANNAGCTLWQFNCVKSHHNSSRWCQGHCGYTRMCCCCSPTSAFTSAFSSFALFQFLCHYYFICNYFRCSFSTNLLWRIFICHDASHNTHCITKMKIKR